MLMHTENVCCTLCSGANALADRIAIAKNVQGAESCQCLLPLPNTTASRNVLIDSATLQRTATEFATHRAKGFGLTSSKLSIFDPAAYSFSMSSGGRPVVFCHRRKLALLCSQRGATDIECLQLLQLTKLLPRPCESEDPHVRSLLLAVLLAVSSECAMTRLQCSHRQVKGKPSLIQHSCRG